MDKVGKEYLRAITDLKHNAMTNANNNVLTTSRGY